MRPTYIASCSFGKDSIATILLAIENNEPLDRIVFCEVMFDHASNISGEIPEHIEWVYSIAIPKLANICNIPIDIVKSQKDYLYFFQNAVGGGRHKGKIYGFPIGGKCLINRDCKIQPIRKYLSAFKPYVQYIGIAKDEPKRLTRLDGVAKISLLDKYGYTEAMARAKCKEYGLLSPIYESHSRNGCWFCPNISIKQFEVFRDNHPDLWAKLIKLSHTSNLCSYGFKYGMSLQDVEQRILWNKMQLKLF